MYTLVGFYDSGKKEKIKTKKGTVAKKATTEKEVPKKVDRFAKVRAVEASAFEKTKSVETLYASQLVSVAKQIGQLIQRYDPEKLDDNIELIKALYNFTNQLTDWALQVSKKVVYQLNNNDLQAWNKHSERMSAGVRREVTTFPVDAQLKKYMDDQVELIKSLPIDAAKRIHKLVYKNLYEGTERAKGLANQIMETEGVSKSNAMRIARTEISRIGTGLTEVRAENSGLAWYIWHSSHDIRTRLSHKLMNNVVCRWEEPPNPEKLFQGRSEGKIKVGKPYDSYHSGNTFNCRCFPSPVIRISDITFPAQVFYDGKLRTMNQMQFAKIAEGELAYPVSKVA